MSERSSLLGNHGRRLVVLSLFATALLLNLDIQRWTTSSFVLHDEEARIAKNTTTTNNKTITLPSRNTNNPTSNNVNNSISVQDGNIVSWQSPLITTDNTRNETNTSNNNILQQEDNKTATLRTNITLQQAKVMSSIDYYGVCGAGHRLQRTVLAHYLSQQVGYSLRVYWGVCDNDKEIYSYLFGPQPLQELTSVSNYGHSIQIVNEVNHFVFQTRPAKPQECLTTHAEFAKQHVKYYQGLRQRFRLHKRVEEFRKGNFDNDAMAVAMHVRAGNGEKGDFTRKQRGIENLDAWLQSVVERILEQNWGKMVLFLATDTHAVLVKLQTILHNVSNVTLVYQDQDWVEDGQGVAYSTGTDKCLQKWESIFVDMMLLSYADVLISPRYSSFTVTLPIQLILAREKEEQKVDRPYCELDLNATSMHCYQDFPDWCANGTTRVRGDMIYVPPPHVNFSDTTKWPIPKLRHDIGSNLGQSFPYNWTEWFLEQNTKGNSTDDATGSKETTLLNNITIQDAKSMSSVDYYGTNGAGHRLRRTAFAHYISQKGGYSLRVNWGLCDNVEVYSHLFGPQPRQELANMTDVNHVISFVNEIPNLKRALRPGSARDCRTEFAAYQSSNVEYYKSLRNRFHSKDKIEAFRQEHFRDDTLTIAVHIRAGNGETGDFDRKRRGIDDVDQWLQNVVNRILEQDWLSENKAVLFLATDTRSVVYKLQVLLHSSTNMKLVYQNQDFPEEGTGISFGSGQCIKRWESAFLDMMLLSYADVLIAPRYSSFTATLPMSLVFAKPKVERKVDRPYCELDKNATEMHCYQDFSDWCANGTTRVRGDWLFVPPVHVNFTDSRLWPEPQLRQSVGKERGQSFPYNWTEWLSENQ